VVSTYTPNLTLEEPANGDYIDTWSTPLNANLTILDTAFGGVTSINVTGASGTIGLTAAQYRPRIFKFTGTLTANVVYQVPSGVGGVWFMSNNTTGAFIIYITSAGGGTNISLPQGYTTPVISDGGNIRVGYSAPSSVAAAGLDTQVQFNQSGSLGASSALTFNYGTSTLSATNIVGSLTGSVTGSVNGSVTGSSGSCTGNAATATTATTASTANALSGAATIPESVGVTAGGTIASTTVGFRGVPASSQGQGSTITLALTDASKRVANTSGGWTIPANGSVAFPVDTTIVLHNNSGATQTVGITSDTLTWAGSTSTGTRTVQANGLATLIKTGTTSWLISGNLT
jgi:hypothetical protein